MLNYFAINNCNRCPRSGPLCNFFTNLSHLGFINLLNKSEIEMNRKVLADIAATEPFSFAAIVNVSKVSTGHAN